LRQKGKNQIGWCFASLKAAEMLIDPLQSNRMQ
jgi:hypothetical protein